MKERFKSQTLYFENQGEKIAAVAELNRLLRADGLPAVHEGLDQKSAAFNIFLCIYETPIENPTVESSDLRT